MSAALPVYLVELHLLNGEYTRQWHLPLFISYENSSMAAKVLVWHFKVTLFSSSKSISHEFPIRSRDRIDPCSDSESEADSPKSVRSRSNGNRKPI